MRGPGLFTMLQFAAGLSMAGPMFVIGFEFARTGEVALGVGFFALGALVSYAPTYFLRQIGGPRAWIRRRLRRGGGSGDDEPAADDGERTAADDSERTATADDTAAEGGEAGRPRRLLNRFGRR